MTIPPTIQTERLTLRAPDASDYADLAGFYASERSHMVGGPMDRFETWRYLASIIGHWTLRGFGRWTVTLKGSDDRVGLIGLHHPEDWPEAEVGWLVYDGFEGKGLANEAATAARTYAYEVLDWTTCISLVDPKNARSAALAQRMGAVQEDDFEHGKYGTMQVWRHPGAEVAA